MCSEYRKFDVNPDSNLKSRENEKKEYFLNLERNEILDINKDQRMGRRGRYEYYFDKTVSDVDRFLIDGKINTVNESILEYKIVNSDLKSENTRTVDFEGEIEEAKKRIINFTRKMGLDLEDRLVESKDIHFLPVNIYKKIENKKDSPGGYHFNEIILNKDFAKGDMEKDYNNHILQHELIESSVTQKILIKGNNLTSAGRGFCEGEKFRYFQESIVEMTNQQVCGENQKTEKILPYLNELIFTINLINDLAERTKESSAKISTKFQIGMFEGKQECLNIIMDTYGKEAFNRLMNMKDDKNSIIKVAESFGLRDAINEINIMNKTDNNEGDLKAIVN